MTDVSLISEYAHVLAQDVSVLRTASADLQSTLKTAMESLKTLAAGVRAQRIPFLERQLELLRRDPHAPGLKLNLASGESRVPGFVNVDGMVRNGGFSPDIVTNLAWGVPFGDGTVESIYCSHFLEHLYSDGEVPHLLAEMYRTLVPGGRVRIVVPDMMRLMEAYVQNDTAFLDDRKRVWDWWQWDRFGTTLPSILEYAGVVRNPHVGSYIGGHRGGYDFETLHHLLREMGFVDIERVAFEESKDAALAACDAHSKEAKEQAPDRSFYSLFTEAQKPHAKPPKLEV